MKNNEKLHKMRKDANKKRQSGHERCRRVGRRYGEERGNDCRLLGALPRGERVRTSWGIRTVRVAGGEEYTGEPESLRMVIRKHKKGCNPGPGLLQQGWNTLGTGGGSIGSLLSLSTFQRAEMLKNVDIY